MQTIRYTVTYIKKRNHYFVSRSYETNMSLIKRVRIVYQNVESTFIYLYQDVYQCFAVVVDYKQKNNNSVIRLEQ